MDKYLSNNNVLRVLAVILSVILWFSVQSPGQSTDAQANGTDKFPIPVKVETSSGMLVTSVQPSTAVVAINENQVNIPQFSEQMLNVDLVANARGLTPGTHLISLSALHMPPVSHTIEPATVTVTLAKQSAVSHAVKVQVEGTPQAGYSVGTPTVSVSSVQLSGAKSALQSVVQVVAEVDVQGAAQDISEQVTLLPVNQSGQPVQGVTSTPATATVSIPVSAPTNSATLEANVTGTPAPGYAVAGVSLSPQTITVYGPGTPNEIQVPVDVSGLNRTTTKKLTVPMPASVQKAEPSTVRATIQIEQGLSKTLKNLTIHVQNAGSGQTVTFTGDSTVDISVTGPKSIISNLQATSIVPYIDVKGLKAGQHTVAVQVNSPNWVQVTQLSHTTISIIIG
jgi:YbbR domain-containing protein